MLRTEPKLARLLVRRPIGPTRDAPRDNRHRRQIIEWEAQTRPEGLDGLYNIMASPMPASWNQIASWLRQIDTLRQAA